MDAEGAITCWGNDDFGETAPPAGRFTSLALGYQHSCAIQPAGTVSCWGNDDSHQTAPPTGSFNAMAAGSAHNCGIRPDGSLACWGAGVTSDGCGEEGPGFGECGQADPPEGTFEEVAGGTYHSCGVREDGQIVCWGCGDEPADIYFDRGQCDST